MAFGRGKKPTAPRGFEVKLDSAIAEGGDGSQMQEGEEFFIGALYGWSVTVALLPGKDWEAERLVPPVVVREFSPIGAKEVSSCLLGPVPGGGATASAAGLAGGGGWGAAVNAEDSDLEPAPEPIEGDVLKQTVWKGNGWEFHAGKLGGILRKMPRIIKPEVTP